MITEAPVETGARRFLFESDKTGTLVTYPQVLDKLENAAKASFRVPKSKADVSFAAEKKRRARFDKLANQWKDETLCMSSTTEITDHPAYQAIIEMGSEAIPWILEDLKRASYHWHAALEAITGENPVRRRDLGDIPRVTEAWLGWGREHGHK